MGAGLQYQALYKQVEQLHYKLRDMLDGKTPLAKQLLKALDDLEYDLETNNEPRDVEASIKNIQNILASIRREGEATMAYRESDTMHRTFETMRQTVRSFKNY